MSNANDVTGVDENTFCSIALTELLDLKAKAARAEAAEAENAKMKEAVELASYQLEQSTHTLAEATRREEAYSARLEAAEAREQEAVRALEKANTPDMFWDAEDPESGGVDEYEVVERYSPGEIVRIQCARSLSDQYGVYVTSLEDEGDWKFTFGTLEECETAIAAASIVKGEKP